MKVSLRAMAYIALVAAVYVAITLAQYGIGFGAIQFRVAESLNLLAFFNPIFVPAVTLGVFLTNLFSPNGIIDVIFGTLATVIALTLIRITKKTTNSLLFAAVWPVVVNAAIIPLVILIPAGGLSAVTFEAYFSFFASVGIGQAVVMAGGYVIFKYLCLNQKNFISRIEGLE